MGMEEVTIDDNAYIMATLPSNVDYEVPTRITSYNVCYTKLLRLNENVGFKVLVFALNFTVFCIDLMFL